MIIVRRIPFCAPTPATLLVRGTAITFMAEGRSLLVFERDNEGKLRALSFDLAIAPKAPQQDRVVDPYPSSLVLDSSGGRIFWFSAFGRTFQVLDTETGKQKVILERKLGQKGFWMEPPYPLSFSNSKKVLAYGYPVTEDGTGGMDGVYSIDLEKEGVNAVNLVVSTEDLMKAALPRKGEWTFVTLVEGDSFIYGLRSDDLIHLMVFNTKTGKAAWVDDCAVLGRSFISSDAKWLAYDCIKPKIGEQIFLQSLVDQQKSTIASGPYMLLDMNSAGGTFALARSEGKKIEVGFVSRKAGFKFTPLLTSASPYSLSAKFVEDGKMLLIRTKDGIWSAKLF